MIAPTTEAELSDFLSEASEPVRIVGGGTRQNLGNSVKAKKNADLKNQLVLLKKQKLLKKVLLLRCLKP